MTNDTPDIKKISNLKVHFLLLILDTLALGTYFSFEALSEIETALSKNVSEIIIDEGAFYILILLGLIFFHLIIAISIHTPISKSIYKEKFAGTAMTLGFFTFIFSGYFVSNYVENKLIKADYHFCGDLSYSGNYKSTHYVWRNKNTDCTITLNNPPTQ